MDSRLTRTESGRTSIEFRSLHASSCFAQLLQHDISTQLVQNFELKYYAQLQNIQNAIASLLRRLGPTTASDSMSRIQRSSGVHTPIGIIIGASIGGAILTGLFGYAAYYIKRRRQSR